MKNPEIITKEEYDKLTVAPISDDFDATREFDSVQEAVDYCNSQPRPMFALGAIVAARITMQDFGFAGDLVHEGELINQ